jgi:hypothetical protein
MRLVLLLSHTRTQVSSVLVLNVTIVVIEDVVAAAVIMNNRYRSTRVLYRMLIHLNRFQCQSNLSSLLLVVNEARTCRCRKSVVIKALVQNLSKLEPQSIGYARIRCDRRSYCRCIQVLCRSQYFMLINICLNAPYHFFNTIYICSVLAATFTVMLSINE